MYPIASMFYSYYNYKQTHLLQATKAILTNKAAIAINQEYAGNSGDLLIRDGNTEVIMTSQYSTYLVCNKLLFSPLLGLVQTIAK